MIAGRRSAGSPAPGVEVAVLAAAGALQTPAWVHTAVPGVWLVPLAALALLVWRLDAATPRRAAVLAWAFGTGWLTAGTAWLFISMHRYGGLPAWMAALAVLALSAALSLYLGAAGAAYARWRRDRAGDVALFAALFLLAELARGVIFTGFPWLAMGYSQVDSPLAALAPWIGVYGIGAVAALAAAAAARAVRAVRVGRSGAGTPSTSSAPPRWRAAAPLAAVSAGIAAVALAGPGDFTRPAGEPLGVALLQTDVAQDEKFAAEHMPQTLTWVGRALVDATARLVVAPETAVPLLPSQLDEVAPGYWPALRRHFADAGRAALVGVPLGDPARGYTNSVAGLGGSGGGSGSGGAAVDGDYRYDKFHLVPFGEFIPSGFRWFTAMMNIPLGDFARGVVDAPSFVVGDQRVAPNVCFEDLFGEELAQRFADPATAPTLLANVSNLGWFGDTAITVQHLNISRMRSLELQRPMVRATNTGATAIVDHRGRVAAMLPPHTRGVLEGTVSGRDGVTPFATWAARTGLWPLGLLATAVVALAVLAGASRTRRDAR